jgi:hypothetical protein
MNTPARELGAARASRVVKCLVDGIRVKPLRTSGKLIKAASRHASRMVQAQFFSHEDPANKSHVAERVRRTGYLQGVQGWESGRTSRGGTAVASTPAGIVRAWLNSPGHRRNIMDRRWTEKSVDKMLRIYGHTELVALTEVDALYARLRDAPTAPAADLRDAEVTHEPPGTPLRRGIEPTAPIPTRGRSVAPSWSSEPADRRRDDCSLVCPGSARESVP